MTIRTLLLSSLLSFSAYSAAASTGEITLTGVLGEKYISRQEWGALTSDHQQLVEEGRIEEEDAKELTSLHHSVRGLTADQEKTPENEAEIVRSMDSLHVKTFGWADLGYHFAIGQSGTVFEGRPLEFTGSHTGGLNRKNAGIAFIGCYDDEGCEEEGYIVHDVTGEMVESAAKVVAYLSVRFNFPINKETVVPRSTLDIAKKGATKFPFSPGNRIIERLDEIIARATEIANDMAPQGEQPELSGEKELPAAGTPATDN